MSSINGKSRRGFTLIEVLVTVAIVAIVALIAAPSMKNFIQMQRLKSVGSELMADVQFARSEAVARGRVVGLRFKLLSSTDTTMSCYVIATRATGGCVGIPTLDSCDCARGPGRACDASAAISSTWTELKTVVGPTALGVQTSPTEPFASPISFDPRSGGLIYSSCNGVGTPPTPYEVDITGDIAGKLRTSITPTGRPSACSCGGTVPGYPACAVTPGCP